MIVCPTRLPRLDKLRDLLALIVLATTLSNHALALEQFTSGHADMAIYNSGTNLLLRYEFASTAVIDGSPVGGTGRIADPALISTIIPENSIFEIPDDPAYSPYWRGRTSWFLPPNNVPGVPDLGIGKQVTSGTFTGDAVTLFLDSIVSRPTGAEFMLINSEGSPVYMDTANPASPNQLNALDHNHYYWFFSEPGTYQIRFRAEAVIQATGLLSSTSAIYHFNVVPEPSTWALAIVGTVMTGILAYRARCRPNISTT